MYTKKVSFSLFVILSNIGDDYPVCKRIVNCLSYRRPSSATTSYEDLSARETVELQEVPDSFPSSPKAALEDTPLSGGRESRDLHASMRRLVRQSSVMDTQRDSDGAIKLTYWF